MTTTYRIYQTIAGDRWDTVAHKNYGNPYGYEQVIAANPDQAGLIQLPGGIRLRIPVGDTAAAAIPAEKLPPWKR